MITCTSYKEGTRTFYNIYMLTQSEPVSITREVVGTLARAEFLACIEALELARKWEFKKGFNISVTSKAVYAHTDDSSVLSRTSDLFRAACVLKLLLEETGAKLTLESSH